MNAAKASRSSKAVYIRKSFCCVAAYLVGVLLFPPPGVSEVEIDPSEGQIDGKTALSFWPGAGEQALLPVGFTVHLVPDASPDQELVEPCGEWFVPAAGKYRFWLEGPGLISPYSSMLTFRGGPFTGRGGVSVSPVLGAGTVRLDSDVDLPVGASMRLLSLESHRRGERLHRELARRVHDKGVYDGVLMPEGSVLAALYDLNNSEFLALSREAVVLPERVTDVVPQVPAPGTSDLVVVLDRPSLLGTRPEKEVELIASLPGGSRRAPDLFVPSAERVFGVWYGLEGKRAILEVKSPEVYLGPVHIPLRPGKVEQFRGDLKRLPSLEVELRLPDGFPDTDRHVMIRRAVNKAAVSQASLPDGQTALEFHHLPPAELDVLLDAVPWLLIEQVDLTDGRDGHLVLEPEVIEITGTVFRGADAHPATVGFGTFRNPGDRAEVDTDDSGNYRMLLFRPGRYSVYVEVKGVEGPPFTDYLLHGLFESQTLDFHVPASNFRVQVIDADSGEGIEGARITADNEYSDENGGPRTVSQPAVTDASGYAALQPLRPGSVEIEAKAPGYRPPQPVVEPVFEDSPNRDITVAMRKIAAGDEIQLLLPDGGPASGAEIQVRSGLGTSPVLWEGQSDAGGRVTLPANAEGAFVLVRHPNGGGMVRRWRSAGSGAAWKLPPAGPPLTIVAEHSWGDPASWVDLAVWVDGFRVQGSALAWLARSWVAATDSRGRWVGSQLPAVPIRILAWAVAERERGLTGALDPLAVEIVPPFPPAVKIPVVE